MAELTEGFETYAAARETFWRRLELLHRALVLQKSTLWRGARSLAVEMGAQSEDAAKFNRASALYFHLFGYEVLNSVVLLREGELHVLARAEKGADLDRALGRENPNPQTLILPALDGEEPDDDDDDRVVPPLQLKVHAWDSAASVQPLVLAAAAAGPTMGVLRSGGSSSASSSGGALLRAWDAAVSVQGLILVDVTRAVGAALALKDDDAIVRTAAAGRVACRALCDGVTRLVEAAFDADRDERATHDALAQQIDALMCDALAPHCARAVPKLRDVHDGAAKRCANAAAVACANATTTRSTRLVESCYFPIVTSGGACTTDAGAASDADAINDDVVVVEFGARFASYCTNVARTFFVEPLPSLEKCYGALRGVHAACVDAMRENAPLSAVAAAAHDYLENNDAAHLAKFLPRHNFGFALGLDFRDDDLVLTRSNSRTFEARMIFNVAIGLHGVPLDAAERRKARGAIRDLKKVSMLIADTVLVQSAGAPPVVLTDFSPTRPALKDWRDVSNLATSQRERAAALAAQRAAAAEAELLAQLDAEAAATKPNEKKHSNVSGAEDKKSTKKSNKKNKNQQKTSSTNNLTTAGETSTKSVVAEKEATAQEMMISSSSKAAETTTKDNVAAVKRQQSLDDDEELLFEASEEKYLPKDFKDGDDDDGDDDEMEAEAASLLERVRAAGRSRWCESCEAAVKDARDFFFMSEPSQSKSVSALERATADLAESMGAWRGIEKSLEQAKSAEALRTALQKASNAGFPAKATAVKRARRRLKEIEAGVPETTIEAYNSGSQQQQQVSTGLSSPLGSTTLERETNAQIQLGMLGMAASQQQFHEVVGSSKRTNKEKVPKPVDELAKYFHGDDGEIVQLREQKIDLTKLVLLAGRGAPKLAPWRDSQPPAHAVAVGRVLGLLGRLAPRVFVNLSAAERSGLLLRGGSPPREWLALANDPTAEAGREAEEAAIKHNLDDPMVSAAVGNAAAIAAAAGASQMNTSGRLGLSATSTKDSSSSKKGSNNGAVAAGNNKKVVVDPKKASQSSETTKHQVRPPLQPSPLRAWGMTAQAAQKNLGPGLSASQLTDEYSDLDSSFAPSPPNLRSQSPRRDSPPAVAIFSNDSPLFQQQPPNDDKASKNGGDYSRRTYSSDAFSGMPLPAKPSRDPAFPPPGVHHQRQRTGDSPQNNSLDWNRDTDALPAGASLLGGGQSPTTGQSGSSPTQPPVVRPSSSWDATPDSFGATRDEISAMAGAAYAAALGLGFPPPPQSQHTKRVVSSSFADAPVFSAAPGARRNVVQVDTPPAVVPGPRHHRPRHDLGGSSAGGSDLFGLNQHQFLVLSENQPRSTPPIFHEDGGFGDNSSDHLHRQRRKKAFDYAEANDGSDTNHLAFLPRFDDDDHLQPPFSAMALQPPPGVLPQQQPPRAAFPRTQVPLFPPPGVASDNRHFFSSSVD